MAKFGQHFHRGKLYNSTQLKVFGIWEEILDSLVIMEEKRGHSKFISY
jgi:hypothetical protein